MTTSAITIMDTDTRTGRRSAMTTSADTITDTNTRTGRRSATTTSVDTITIMDTMHNQFLSSYVLAITILTSS